MTIIFEIIIIYDSYLKFGRNTARSGNPSRLVTMKNIVRANKFAIRGMFTI